MKRRLGALTLGLCLGRCALYPRAGGGSARRTGGGT